MPVPFGGAPFGGLSPPASPPSQPTPTAISTTAATFATAVAARVSWAQELTGTWTEIEHCYCSNLHRTVAPAIDQATLLWEYGIKMHPGEATFGVVSPL